MEDFRRRVKQGGLPTTSLVNTQFKLIYLIDPKRVSRSHRLLPITAYVLRFVTRIQRKPCHTGSSTATEMDNLHNRLTFDLDKKSKIFYYSQKEDPKISRIAEFGGEML